MEDGSVIEEMRIQHLLNAWAYARDNGEWDMLADFFCTDGTINISWMHASGSEFVARSRDMSAKRKPGTHLKHVTAAPFVRVAGNRAFSICHVNTESRDKIDGHLVDLTAWFRMFDLLRKEDESSWRIYRRTAVYEKDRITPVDPRGIPAELFDDLDLSGYPPATQYLSWYLTRLGVSPRTDIISVYSNEEEVLKHDGDAWLGGEDV